MHKVSLHNWLCTIAVFGLSLDCFSQLVCLTSSSYLLNVSLNRPYQLNAKKTRLVSPANSQKLPAMRSNQHMVYANAQLLQECYSGVKFSCTGEGNGHLSIFLCKAGTKERAFPVLIPPAVFVKLEIAREVRFLFCLAGESQPFCQMGAFHGLIPLLYSLRLDYLPGNFSIPDYLFNHGFFTGI